MNKVIFWDFQGTLAHNDWMISKALYKVLRRNEPNNITSIDQFKELKIRGIPSILVRSQKEEGIENYSENL